MSIDWSQVWFSPNHCAVSILVILNVLFSVLFEMIFIDNHFVSDKSELFLICCPSVVEIYFTLISMVIIN